MFKLLILDIGGVLIDETKAYDIGRASGIKKNTYIDMFDTPLQTPLM